MKFILLFILTTLSFFSNCQIDTTSKSLEEIQVYGTVRASSDVPVTQKNLNKEFILKNYMGQDMSYILNLTPSINTYSDNGLYNSYTYFRLRGVDQTRINMTLNGIPLNEPEDQGAYFSNYSDFSSNINSVQIQRGIGTSSYGTSSYIGSINFEGPNLTDSNYTSIESGYGSFNTKRLSMAYNSGVKNKLGLYLRYSDISSNGYRYNSFNKSKTIFTSFGYFGNKSIVKLTAFSGQSLNGMAYLATNIEDINVDPRTNYLTKNEQDRFYQNFTSLQWIYKLNRNSTITTSSFYNNLNGNYDVLSGDLLNFKLKSNFTGIMTTYSLSKNKIKVQSGLNFNYYERYHMMSIYPDYSNNLYLNKGIKYEFSTFFKTTYNLTNRLIVYGDIQYRNVNFQYINDKSNNISLNPLFWNFINPKAGFKLNLKKFSYYLSTGISNREPTRNDLLNGYDDVSPINSTEYVGFGVDTLNIRSIKPERVIDIESGFDFKSLDGRFSSSICIYYMDFKNEIAPIGKLSYIGLPMRKNVDNSFRSGIEIDFKYNPIKNLVFLQTFNYSYNRIKKYTSSDSITYNNVSPLLTPNIISNSSIYFTIKKITIGGNLRYIGESYLDNTMNNNYITPDYFLIDMSISSNINKFNVKLLINNIFNIKYFTSGYVGYNGSNNTPAYFIGAPRNVYLSISYKI